MKVPKTKKAGRKKKATGKSKLLLDTIFCDDKRRQDGWLSIQTTLKSSFAKIWISVYKFKYKLRKLFHFI